jgi:nucleoside-diphosphate-sugar epimerase
MLQKQKEGQEIKLFPLRPTRDFVYVKDVVSANIYAMNNYKENSGDYYEVGSGESRPFEDVLDILKIDYTHHTEDMIPQGYQFNTRSNPSSWMFGWGPEYNLERGLEDYLGYLNQ